MKLKVIAAASIAALAVSGSAFAAQAKAPAGATANGKEMSVAAMNQNTNRAGQASANWFRNVKVNGGVNVDSRTGDTSTPFTGQNNKHFGVNDAYLNVYANVNSFTNAFIQASYGQFSTETANAQTEGSLYSAAYGSANNFDIEQAYLTFSKKQSPYFLQVGKQYQNFGRYTTHPITRTMTQVLTESLQTSAELGFVSGGYTGSVSVFKNPSYQLGADNSQGHTPVNWIASLGMSGNYQGVSYNAGVGYINNMTGVNDIASRVGTVNGTANSFKDRVAGYDVYAGVKSGPFGLKAQAAAALQRFNKADLNTGTSTDADGARLAAYNVMASYDFTGFGKHQTMSLGYGVSHEAVDMLLPKNRVTVGYNVDLSKNTYLGVEVAHNTDYSTSDVGKARTGTGKTSNAVGVRLGTVFN